MLKFITFFLNGRQHRSKIEKVEPLGTPKGRQEAKMMKRGVVPNSLAVLGAIFEENGLQDGGQNREKVDKKVIQNLIIFVVFFNIILKGFLMKNRWKIDRKMMLKSIQISS